MNFNEVYKKIAQIDGVLSESAVNECGEPMGMPAPSAPSTPPVSMSVNINAQGIENIKSMMDLWTKVNPDMMPKVGNELPQVSPELSIGGPGPSISSPADDIKKDMTKLISLDEPEDEKELGGDEFDNDDEPEDESRSAPGEYGGEHDEDPIGGDKPSNPYPFGDDDEEDEAEEAYANEPNEKYAGVDAVTHDGNDLNKSKKTFPKVAGGDNPMQKVKEELAAALAAYKSR